MKSFSKPKQKQRTKLLILSSIIVSLISLLSVKYMLTKGFHYGHDALWHVQRITAMFQELKSHQFPVRWASSLDNGYGIPLFNFVYPGPYYLSAILMFMGIGNVSALNIVVVAFYTLGGLGMFILFSKNISIGITVAILYLFAPYQFVNIFVRTALGEIAVMGIAPWVFLSIKDINRTKKIKLYHPIPLALALLSHNFLGLILAVLAFAYITYTQPSIASYASLAISFGISAFFVIPMFFERSYLLSSVEKNFSFKYSDHFIYLKQLIYSKWDYWFSMPGIEKDGMTFQLGFANILLLLVSITTILLLITKKTKWFRNRYNRATQRPVSKSNTPHALLTSLTTFANTFTSNISNIDSKSLIFFITATVFFIFLTTPYSMQIWRSIPLMQAMQFPWRFLSFPTILIPIATGIILQSIYRANRNMAILIMILSTSLAIINTRNYHRSMRTLSQKEFQDLHKLYADKTTTSARSEIMPKWAKQERWDPINPNMLGKRIAKERGGVKLHNIKESTLNITFTATSENNQSALRIYRNYFPAWQAVVDRKKLNLSPSETGEIILPLIEGRHEYRVWIGQTTLEQVSNMISITSILVAIAIHLATLNIEEVRHRLKTKREV